MRNRDWMRLGFVLLTLFAALQLIGSATAAPAPAAASSLRDDDEENPIVEENRHPGSDLWQLPSAGFQVADDIGLQIKGYPAKSSTRPGGSVDLRVTVTPAQDFQVDVLRLGYYQGHGARLLRHLGPIHGIQQQPCATEPDTRMLSCDWKTSLKLHVSEDWLSGVYVAVLSSANGFQSLIPFWVVDDSRHSDLLFLSSLNTYQAYNNFPYDPPPSDPQGLPQTGHSLYDFNSANGIPAVKVSFDRPFNSQYGGPGDGGVFDFEPELIAFVEQNGYDVTYAPDPVIDNTPAILLHHKAVVIGGHSEYWTMAAYNGAIAARAYGVGLAFISANEIYWQVRYERNKDEVARRVMVGYKDFAPDPVPDPRLRTIRWRALGRPEQKLVGVQFPVDGNMNFGGQPYVAENTDHWVYAGSGLSDDVPVNVEAVGYEIDNYDPTVGRPEGTEYTILAESPFVNFNSINYIHNSSIYRGMGGNWVWATGSMDWSWTLSPGGSTTGQSNVRPEMQIVTRNVLNRMIQDAPCQGSSGSGRVCSPD
jgi:hypothetical protein